MGKAFKKVSKKTILKGERKAGHKLIQEKKKQVNYHQQGVLQYWGRSNTHQHWFNTIKLSYFSTSKRSENKTLTEDFQA
jgi:hypothetical protein